MPSNPFAVVLLGTGEQLESVLCMAEILRREHGSKIVLLCKTREDAREYLRRGVADQAYAISGAYNEEVPGCALEEGQRIETRFQTHLHYHLVDRRRFFTGSIRFFTARAKMAYSAMVKQVVQEFAFIDRIMEAEGVTLLINGSRVASDVARARGVPQRHLNECLYENRKWWFETFHRESDLLGEAYALAQRAGIEPVVPEEPRQLDSYLSVRKSIYAQMRPTRMLVSLAREMARYAWYRFKGYEKVKIFGFSGFETALGHVRQVCDFRRLTKLARVSASEAARHPYVFYPLAGEPEVTISTASPEMMDQISIIQMLARELPVGTYLAVKEHLIGIGARPRDFYRIIASMPNVLLINPEERGIDLVRSARAVAVIGSTVAMEAAAWGIPVLSFGAHNFFNVLEGVRLVRGWHEVRPALSWALSFDKAAREELARTNGRFFALLRRDGIEMAGTPDQRGRHLLSALQASLAWQNGTPS